MPCLAESLAAQPNYAFGALQWLLLLLSGFDACEIFLQKGPGGLLSAALLLPYVKKPEGCHH